jgi:hypothetical protein
MKRKLIAEGAFLLVVSAGIAAAQKAPVPILVLQMPADANTNGSIDRTSSVLINYNGRMRADRKIWVRVFRGSKDDLKTNIPRLTPRNKCAVYTQAVVLSVDHGTDGQLRIGDLENYFEMTGHQQIQRFTLIFEEDVEPSHSEPLYLERSQIARYFDNGVEITLTAGTNLVKEWRKEADAELAASHPPQKSWYQTALAVVGIGGVVQAAGAAHSSAPPPPAAEQPQPAPTKPEPQCQSVQPVAFRAQLASPHPQNGTQEALAPIFQLQNTACGE